MARICELCKKKVGMNDSCFPPYFVNQIKPYANIFQMVSAPGSMGVLSCDSFLCVDCMKMTNYLYAYKWAGKSDRQNSGNNNSNKCSNDDIRYAQEYVKNRLNGVSDQRYKSFFLNALTVSETILQRRNDFQQIKNDLILRVKEFADKRLQQLKAIKDEVNSSALVYKEGDSFEVGKNGEAYAIVNDELVYYNASFEVIQSADTKLSSYVNEIIQIIENATPMNAIEDLVQQEIDNCIDITSAWHFKRDKIKYFKEEDNRQYVSNVHGGGGSGGGANLSGALIGGALFGGAGAIVGSQVGTEIKIDPIKTDIVTIGEKRLILVYEENGTYESFVIFGKHAYAAFLELIPEKSYSKVMLDEKYSTSTPVNQETPQPADKKAVNVVDELRQYKSLLDDGIITQEEFDNKKKELLSL